jgi:23S rRNA (uracil1939-C5)-methyltransferase
MSTLHELTIESVDLEGQGIAHDQGKVIFIEGALIGEVVDVEITRNKTSYAKGEAIAWHRESYQRVRPKCPHFGTCGGCAMQHLEASAQLAAKQRALEDTLWHVGKLKPEQILPPLDGPAWNYRTRARLTARMVEKKGGMLFGFHERKSSFVAVMDSCQTLHARVSDMMPAVRDLIASLSIARRIPQAEVAVGDGESPVIVWVLRILEPLNKKDQQKLRTFADEWGVQFWLQPGGPATAAPFYPIDFPALEYRLPEFDLRMPFSPVDFTQVNPAMNQIMVKRAVDLLALEEDDRVADFFCGLGNFTLAVARRLSQKPRNRPNVIGIEGSQALTRRAFDNAQLHGLQHLVEFSCCNLFEIDHEWLKGLGRLDKILLDPPREGAHALCLALAQQAKESNTPSDQTAEAADIPAQRIVYVSCNPATLARDAAILVYEGGWKLKQAGIINMFPQTTHVESIAVFERR